MSEIISKAMNSTLGTANFKAFDELLLDSKSLIPGDDVIVPFSDSSYWSIRYDVPLTETELVKFTMPLTGTIQLNYEYTSSTDDYGAYMNVRINGTIYKEMSTTSVSWNSDDTPNKLLISANRGDVITITGKSSKATTSDGKTTYNFRARLYDIRYRVIDAPALVMSKSYNGR